MTIKIHIQAICPFINVKNARRRQKFVSFKFPVKTHQRRHKQTHYSQERQRKANWLTDHIRLGEEFSFASITAAIRLARYALPTKNSSDVFCCVAPYTCSQTNKSPFNRLNII